MPPAPFRLLCLSHLVWEHRLFQRPQQLMSRFEARGHDMLYLTLMSSKRWIKAPRDERDIAVGSRGRARNLPFLPLSNRIKAVSALSQRRMVSEARAFLLGGPQGRRVVWCQHPGFIQILDDLPADVVVYDNMDPFQSFKKSASDIAEAENRLLARADVVFTGGRSMHRQREGRNPDMHCFPSGIDYPHFARAAQPGEVPADLAALARPVLAYFGAVDERIDWELMRALCRSHREWSVVFIGPLILMDRCPIDEPNFHYLGGRDYAVLPDYMRGFDVCLIPWLVNDLTRFMSPTKTPEYLASGRPVVSTRIPDVEADYGDVVYLADSAGEYIAACERAVAAGIGPSLKPPAARTWDETAEAMEALVNAALDRTAAAR
jgi:UDP-galactopyranose mutase